MLEHGGRRMRLIDADELKEWITAHCDIELEPVIEKEVLRVIDDQATVIDMDKVIKSITNMEDKAVKRACEARRSGNNDKVAYNDGKTVAYGAVKEIIGNEWMG